MINAIIYLLLFFSCAVFGQVDFPLDQFSKKEIKNLNQLNLQLNAYTFNDVSFNNELKQLAFYNKKRKQNKVWAFALSGAGTFLLATGVAIDNKKDLHGYKALMYMSATMYFGASIPFFVGNIKNKNRMKKKLIFVEEKLKILK